MTRRSISIVCLLLASAALLAACGGGDDNGDKGGLSSDERLLVIQARGDIGEFCSVADTGENELFDRDFEAMLTGVRDLAKVYRDNPNATIDIPIEKKKLTMKQVMREQSDALRKGCGKDAKQQAGVLEAALQQKQ
jgi:hypothetical protein